MIVGVCRYTALYGKLLEFLSLMFEREKLVVMVVGDLNLKLRWKISKDLSFFLLFFLYSLIHFLSLSLFRLLCFGLVSLSILFYVYTVSNNNSLCFVVCLFIFEFIQRVIIFLSKGMLVTLLREIQDIFFSFSVFVIVFINFHILHTFSKRGNNKEIGNYINFISKSYNHHVFWGQDETVHNDRTEEKREGIEREENWVRRRDKKEERSKV